MDSKLLCLLFFFYLKLYDGNVHCQRSTMYVGFTVIIDSSLNGYELKFLDDISDELKIMDDVNKLRSILKEKPLVPFHSIDFYYNPSGIVSNIRHNPLLNCNTLTSYKRNYCKFIPHQIISDSSNYSSSGSKHYVIWINTNYCKIHYLLPSSSNSIRTRVRYFDDIEEARNYFKKVIEIMATIDNRYLIYLISKEGFIILEKNNGYNNDMVEFIKGKRNVCPLCPACKNNPDDCRKEATICPYS